MRRRYITPVDSPFELCHSTIDHSVMMLTGRRARTGDRRRKLMTSRWPMMTILFIIEESASWWSIHCPFAVQCCITFLRWRRGEGRAEVTAFVWWPRLLSAPDWPTTWCAGYSDVFGCCLLFDGGIRYDVLWPFPSTDVTILQLTCVRRGVRGIYSRKFDGRRWWPNYHRQLLADYSDTGVLCSSGKPVLILIEGDWLWPGSMFILQLQYCSLEG